MIVNNKEEFIAALSHFDGGAKYFTNKKGVNIVDQHKLLPNSVYWNYAFSDELDCINWSELTF